MLQEWFWQDNKINENQWKIAETIYTFFKVSIFYLFWPCPATLEIYFSEYKIAEIS
jgi:hypothetical protein